MSNWNTSAYKRCRGCGQPLTLDEPTMCIYGRGAYHVRCDPNRRPNDPAANLTAAPVEPADAARIIAQHVV